MAQLGKSCLLCKRLLQTRQASNPAIKNKTNTAAVLFFNMFNQPFCVNVQHSVCVCACLALCDSVCWGQHPNRHRKLLLLSVPGRYLWLKEEGLCSGKEAMHGRLAVPAAWDFWQPIRGEQIRPHTCLTFGELAARVVQGQMLRPGGRSGHRTFHLLSSSISFSGMLIYTRGAAANLYE